MADRNDQRTPPSFSIMAFVCSSFLGNHQSCRLPLSSTAPNHRNNPAARGTAVVAVATPTPPRPTAGGAAAPAPRRKDGTGRRITGHDVGRRQVPPEDSSPNGSSPVAALCNSLEEMVNEWVEPQPLRPSVDPTVVLAGNFAPVGELPPTPCPVVKGRIPECLRGGVYVRNGPNPQHRPRGPLHLFDGDGMIHSLLLPADGGSSPAVLCSRFVRTNKYQVENRVGSPVFPNFFTFRGVAGVARSAIALARLLTGQMNPREGLSPGNVGLIFFHGRLFAVGEPDLPYALRLSPENGDVTTIGRCKFDSKPFEGMTVHPKKDADTGEVFAFRYRPISPFLTYFRFDEGGRKQPDVPIFSVPRFSLFHDFAITKHFAVFPDIQIQVDYLGMATGDEQPLLKSDHKKISRIGVIPRNAASGEEMKWFDVPGFNPMHCINAWDEVGDGGEVAAVVLVAPNMFNVSDALETMGHLHCGVEMVRIDLRSNTATRTPLSVKSLDMGVINPAFTGKKNRYAYLAVGGPFPLMKGVAKLDLALADQGTDCVVACRDYGPACYGGEPFFVAREGAADEDDGYVVTYVHDEESGESRFVVMDARSPELDVVAEVLLPRRVPYGFHGVFAGQNELRNQRP